ncbi:MAG: metalloregulator ArsR/SmtB family transcription factor [Bacteroidetes bacterium]|nr:metalloregulator ArsR/SmtB family transcription factor [Bacteroidota bacterium]
MTTSLQSLIQGKNLGISAKTLRALSHPLRLYLLGFIDEHKKINVNKIYRTLKLEQSLTSQHLRILRDENLVITAREGKFIFYSLNYSRLKKIEELVAVFFGA